ncbi:TRAP transporter small permease [Tropicimonas sp. IMCC6043]|uniref:TRAP transporter small permease n=1 Tax=Tropicimonas sp. IMCC6043 TaxID=2510645 RepID=UPI00101CD9AA|nr:TRAP transporter small permease subunit [Tropicimonas sp. IMCC6043]RYH07870.1 TRAP transporter small permease subunit [Tropicimonas sp. IMCC6043]
MAEEARAPMSKLGLWHGRFLRLCEWISATMFAVLFLTFVAQVFWRYVLRDPLVWTLEVAGILFVALSLFTAATQMPLREHVALDLVMDMLPKAISRWLRVVSLLVFSVIMLLSIPDTIRVLEWMFKEFTFALHFNLGYLFVLMIGFVCAYAAKALFDGWHLAHDGARKGDADV